MPQTTRKAGTADKSSSQDPGSKNSSSDKKMLVLLMECNATKSKALLKALDDAGFDVWLCNDLSTCIHVLGCGYNFGFALVAPTIDGRDGYMPLIRLMCSEQNIPLKEINENTLHKITREGFRFAQAVH